ncbi:MAG: PDZ domain-containing protein [Bdellovibrionales bacterium]|nr:PDZ domain-containing protein [Bdellovibrionales bacterium]
MIRNTPLLLTFVMFLATSPSSFGGDKTDAQYWEETELSLDEVTHSKHYSREECYRTLQTLKGCFDLVNVLAGSAGLQLVPNELLNTDDFKVEHSQKIYGAFTLARLKEPAAAENLSIRDSLEKSRQQMKTLLAALERAFASNAKADFKMAIHDLVPKIPRKVSQPELAAQAINAYLATAMDPHTRIESRQKFEDESRNGDESFAGVGMHLREVRGKVFIGNFIPGGPAGESGLAVGDEISAIDSEKATGVADVVKRARGPIGTTVTITVLRAGEPKSFTIVRRKIEIPNVTAEITEEMSQRFGYVKINSFVDNNLCGRVETAIVQLQRNGARGLILDLRGNGGGFLNQAICVGGLFAGKTTIVQTANLLEDEKMKAGESSVSAVTTLPMVTLIDAGSASASEVVSGALQDHRRSWIVGERSFGKATVQGASMTSRRGVMLWQTVARFYQPSGRTNQLVGILPDIEAPIRPMATDDERAAFREEDLPYVLPKLGTPWVQPRQDEVSKINSCVLANRKAENAYARSPETADYQKLVAQEVLLCTGAGY